jgi:hypothetical protein
MIFLMITRLNLLLRAETGHADATNVNMKMPLKTIGIEFWKPAISFDAASELMSYVAYPENDNKRIRFAAALCRVEHLLQRDPQWKVTPKLIRPSVFAPNEKTFYHDLHDGLETLRRHLTTASLILHPHFESLKTGKPLPKIDGLPPTVDNVTQVMARREGWDEVQSQSTFESRVWNAVKPVAHLAFCFFHKVCMRRNQSPSGRTHGMLESINPYPDEETLRDILRISELFRRHLPKITLLRFHEDETIQFVESNVDIIESAVTRA